MHRRLVVCVESVRLTYFPRHDVLAVHELRAKLDRMRRDVVRRPRAAAETVSRLEDGDGCAGVMQFARSAQSCRTGANDR